MRRPDLSDLRPLVLVGVSCVALAACPLPVSRTEASSAPVVGTIVWADGRPVANAEIAVSTEGSSRLCGMVAHRTRSDALGAFALPGTQRHHKVTWFIPNLDVFAPGFLLCAAPAGTLRRAYQGFGSLADTAPPDTVACVVWEWEGDQRVSCNGQADRGIVTGGRWTEVTGEGGGFYRLFRIREGSSLEPHDVYVQWVERLTPAPGDTAAPRYRVRATASLPFDRKKVSGVQDVQLWQREGRWLASLHGTKHAFMDDFARAELVFELGPPGQARHIAGP